MEQPEGFSLTYKGDYVYRLQKALHGLKQAPRAWYSRLDKYLQKQGFKRGGVDDIMFGSNRDELAKGFAEEMKLEFEMSMIGELSFYLGLQIQLKNTGTFIS